MRRAEAKEQTREALLLAALECFAEQGIHGPSLDAICARANRTRGAFYVHFDGREALVAAVVERTFSEYITALASALHHGDLDDAVDPFAKLLETSQRSERPFLRLGTQHFHLMLSAASRYPSVKTQLDRSIEAGTRMLLLVPGSGNRGQAELLVSLLVGLLAVPNTPSRIERIRGALKAML